MSILLYVYHVCVCVASVCRVVGIFTPKRVIYTRGGGKEKKNENEHNIPDQTTPDSLAAARAINNITTHGQVSFASAEPYICIYIYVHMYVIYQTHCASVHAES